MCILLRFFSFVFLQNPPATTTTTTTTTSTPSPPSAYENEYPDTLEDISEMYLEIRSLLLQNYRRVSFILFVFYME